MATAEAGSRDGLFSPQPRKAHSVHFTAPFLPSRHSSPPPPASTEGSPRTEGERKRRRMTPGTDSAHHNLPWTEEEKRRLEELLAIYPEEQVQSRRWAKIAAAIGTRTAGQVANRYNKLMVKRRRRTLEGGGEEDEPIDLGEDLDLVLADTARRSKEYREYQMLRRTVALLESNPSAAIHHGFRCDGCEAEPIVGARWRCVRCVEPHAVDLCQECYERGDYASPMHRPDHRFIRQRGV